MEIEELQTVYKKALDAAAKQLSYRTLSHKELREKLLRKEFTEDAVDYAVEWLSLRGLLNDAVYAESIVRSYERRGYGIMRIRQELYRRGIEKDMSEDVLSEFCPDFDKMEALLDKRLRGDVSDRKEVNKAVAALQRRGYRWEEIRKVLQAYSEGAEIEDEW